MNKKLAIVGSGVVGQATGKGFLEKGHSVIFSDINRITISELKNEGYDAKLTEELVGEDLDALFFSVSTPTVDDRIHLEFLKSAAANIAENYLGQINHYVLLVIRSTIPPGTTEDFLIPIFERYSEKKAGKDFGVCANPEYLRENSNVEDFNNPWLVLIGELDSRSGDLLESIYGKQNCPVYRVSLRTAEMQKYVHNLFNACKISFFNEMRMICREADIDADQVFPLVAESAEASWNKSYGIKDMGPFGGSCLPKDTMAFLTWAHDNFKQPMMLLDATIRVNNLIKEGEKDEEDYAKKIMEEALG